MIQAVIHFADGTIKGRYSVATLSDLEAQIDVAAGETYEIEEIISPAPPEGADA